MVGNQGIIEKLFQSFTDLEGSIGRAKKTLSDRGCISPEILTRIDSYNGILAKQRRLAGELCKNIEEGNWVEVSRHVELINGLSSMIRDDARAILSALCLNSDTKEDDTETYVC